MALVASEFYVLQVGPAWLTQQQADAAADQTLANAQAAAGVAWVGREADAAKTYEKDLDVGMVALVGTLADDQRAYDVSAIGARTNDIDALATAGVKSAKAYADAELAQAQADCPAWLTIESANAVIGAGYV